MYRFFSTFANVSQATLFLQVLPNLSFALKWASLSLTKEMQQQQQSLLPLAAPILTRILLSEMLFCETKICRLKLEKNQDLAKLEGS